MLSYQMVAPKTLKLFQTPVPTESYKIDPIHPIMVIKMMTKVR